MLFFPQLDISRAFQPPVSTSSEEERQRSAYRAALLSVFLHTQRKGPGELVSGLFPPFLPQPMSLEQAYETLRDRLAGEYRRRAFPIATSRLAKIVYDPGVPPEGRRRARAGLEALLGPEGLERFDNDVKLVRDRLLTALRRSEGRPPEEEPPEGEQTPVARGPVRRRPPTSQELDQLQLDIQQGLLPEWVFDRVANGLVSIPPPGCYTPCAGFSNLPLRTLVTQVQVGSVTFQSYNALAAATDPRSWGRSPLWRAAYEVVPSGYGFTPSQGTYTPGTPWSGYFYEYVDWGWEERVLASFQCYLGISFAPDAGTRAINERFTLHSCQGSLLYSRLSQTGVDVDEGGQIAGLCDPADAGLNPDEPAWFVVCTRKALRYTDLLDRLTSNQGAPQAGAALSYMAPIVAGLWVNELVHGNLYAVEIQP